MTKKSDAPAIRFKGFSDAWEQRKLGELALFNPKDELPQTFEYVDLESVVGTEMLSHRTEVKSSAPSRAQRLAHTGDLFYQTVRPYQKNNYLFEKPDNNYVFSTGYAQMRPYVDGYFLLSLVQSERFVKVVLDNCTGTSYPAINANDLAEIEVAAPSDESEAQRIGTIFRSIDNLITLHQRKFEKLTNVKKSMLEKMFPQNGSSYPEIRFKGFTDPWEQRKVSELFRVTRGYVLAATQTETTKTDEKPYPVYSSQTKDKGLMGYYKDYLYEDAITWTTDGANAGTVNYRAGKFYCTNVCGVLLSNEVKANQMIAEALNSVAKGYVSYVGNPKLMNNVMADIVIQIPTQAEEREQLSSFFAKLDNLITLHQRKGKAAVTGCSNDANNSKGVYCKARDFGYKCYKKVKSQQIRCLIAVFIFFV